ncbi:hypothetical protein Tco_0226992 [Tanacetum coccineum]|uniref:Uncharacterized protein n=1 Tax=Tanacetum coccineum TaxID=301880 RepID=A0ABQ4WJ96_9ASTR
MKETAYEILKDEQKKQLGKNNKAKMTLYNALPRKEYKRVELLALKAKVTREQTSDDSDSQGGSDEELDEEETEAFNLMARNFQKLFRKGNLFGCGNRFSNGANRKLKENKAIVGGAWSDSEDGNELLNNATCLMEIDSQEVVSKPSSSNYDLKHIDLQK